MGAQAKAAPVIIKRKKVVGGGGHHGGAWKVAYADFVTAMMAFFMLMWLLNATTEQQRKGIADFFSPTIPVNRISGGGDGAFGGDSVFSEDTLARNGTGATVLHTAPRQESRGRAGGGSQTEAGAQEEILKEVEAMLMGRGGESKVMENALRHIVTRITDEGLVIELFALKDVPLFEADSDAPTQLMRDLAVIVAQAAGMVSNQVAVGGHVAAVPLVRRDNPVWDLSAQRATAVRHLLEGAGMAGARVQRVTGHADRDPAVANPMARRNNRIEVILLRDVQRN
jgi:chemotaxis protein MotB